MIRITKQKIKNLKIIIKKAEKIYQWKNPKKQQTKKNLINQKKHPIQNQ
jgi:hypothetical protein